MGANQSKYARFKRVQAGKVADLERQISTAEQRTARAVESLQLQTKKNKNLREKINQLQLSYEELKDDNDAVIRSNERNKGATKDLEASNSQLAKQNMFLADQLE